MPRVRSLEGRKAGVVAWVIQRMARFAVGCELNPIKVQAHFSRGMLASFVSNALLDTGRSLVGKDVVHLVRIRAASLNGCPFWMDLHAAVGGKVGLTSPKIEAALGIAESNDLSERERIVLEYTDRVSATPVDVSDEFFESLQQHFSEREILELTSHIAHENYNAKMNRPLRVEANNLCQLPIAIPPKTTN